MIICNDCQLEIEGTIMAAPDIDEASKHHTRLFKKGMWQLGVLAVVTLLTFIFGHKYFPQHVANVVILLTCSIAFVGGRTLAKLSSL